MPHPQLFFRHNHFKFATFLILIASFDEFNISVQPIEIFRVYAFVR